MSDKKVLKKIIDEIFKVSKNNKSPVAIQSSLFPLISKKIINNNLEVRNLMYEILNIFSGRTVLMPTFINYLNSHQLEFKTINLDKLKSSTGVLSEEFRKYKYSSRSISPTMPWSIFGNDRDYLVNLKPNTEWGKNSILEWMQKKDAQILMIGPNKVDNVLKHRVELINKKIVKYRTIYKFKRRVLVNKKKYIIEQKYFGMKNGVMEPNFENLWKNNFLTDCRVKNIHGLKISSYKTLEYIKEFEKKLKKFLRKKFIL